MNEKTKEFEKFVCEMSELINRANEKDRKLLIYAMGLISMNNLTYIQSQIDYLVKLVENRTETRAMFNIRHKLKRPNKAQKQFVRNRDGNICNNCKKQFPPEFLHVDHIKPLSKGGDNAPWNLQILCRDCNFIKASHEFEARKQ